MAPQETDPDLPMSAQESLVQAWVSGSRLQGRGTEGSSACMGPFEGGHHYLHCLHHSLLLLLLLSCFSRVRLCATP